MWTPNVLKTCIKCHSIQKRVQVLLVQEYSGKLLSCGYEWRHQSQGFSLYTVKSIYGHVNVLIVYCI